VEEVDVPDAAPYVATQGHPGDDDLQRMRDVLQASERPLVVVGGQPWTEDAHATLGAWCTESGLPVATAWRCQDYVDNALPVYVGHLGLGPDPKLVARLREADVLLVVGARFGDVETGGYEHVTVPRASGTLVHVHPGPEELGRVYQPELGILAGGPQFVDALRHVEPLESSRWRAWAEDARSEYVDNLRHVPRTTAVDLGDVMAHLRERLPDDAIVTNGAGNFTVWAHRFYEFHRYRTQLAPISGAMGYGVPAAIAAKVVHPDRVALCIAGDGDFLMSAQELATAVQYELPIVVVVADNGMYGTIRMHQELQFPGRVSGTALRNPDFAALARAYGGHGERVERSDDFPDALERALASGLPSVLHVLTDSDAITPRRTLTEIRESAIEK
jgi:acetolactate synthase-1/2/3 large subunit